MNSDPAAERAAYDALEGTVSVMDLLVENPGKVRLDEASLNRPPPEDEAPPAAAPPLPVDAALQRALHLEQRRVDELAPLAAQVRSGVRAVQRPRMSLAPSRQAQLQVPKNPPTAEPR